MVAFAALSRLGAVATRAIAARGLGGCGLGLVALAAPQSQPARALASPASAPPPAGKVKLALLQIMVGADKAANLKGAESAVREAAAAGAQLVCLPECFNSPYGAQHFPEYAEEVPPSKEKATESAHPSTHMMCRLAAELGIYLVGGSIPERDGATGKLYNTCVAFGPDGAMLAKHRKVHLFDIDVPGKIRFFESETLSSPTPSELPLFDTPWGRIGLGICYDIRFPELASLMRDGGAHMLIYPSAFNMVTGPLHWELLARARAVDTQCFVALPSPARDTSAGYVAWGHSLLVSPWGKVVASAEDAPTTVYADVDLAEVHEPRQSIPVFDQKRADLYDLSWTGGERSRL